MKIRADKSAVIQIVVGLLIILAGLGFLYYRIDHQLNELSLIRHGQATPGHIIRCTEETDVDGNDYHYCDYTFTLSDGRTFNKQSVTMPGGLEDELTDLTNPYPAEIEYLADNPEISKIKNTGSTNLFNWTWHTLGLGIFLLFVFAGAGLLLLSEGIKELINIGRNRT